MRLAGLSHSQAVRAPIAYRPSQHADVCFPTAAVLRRGVWRASVTRHDGGMRCAVPRPTQWMTLVRHETRPDIGDAQRAISASCRLHRARRSEDGRDAAAQEPDPRRRKERELPYGGGREMDTRTTTPTHIIPLCATAAAASASTRRSRGALAEEGLELANAVLVCVNRCGFTCCRVFTFFRNSNSSCTHKERGRRQDGCSPDDRRGCAGSQRGGSGANRARMGRGGRGGRRRRSAHLLGRRNLLLDLLGRERARVLELRHGHAGVRGAGDGVGTRGADDEAQPAAAVSMSASISSRKTPRIVLACRG